MTMLHVPWEVTFSEGDFPDSYERRIVTNEYEVRVIGGAALKLQEYTLHPLDLPRDRVKQDSLLTLASQIMNYEASLTQDRALESRNWSDESSN